MLLPTRIEIEAAAAVVYRAMPATPQYRWALSSQRLGTNCWLKHDEVAAAMRALLADTHNLAEGAGAAGFAAAMQERDTIRGLVVGTTLSGGNVDSALLARVLAGAPA